MTKTKVTKSASSVKQTVTSANLRDVEEVTEPINWQELEPALRDGDGQVVEIDDLPLFAEMDR